MLMTGRSTERKLLLIKLIGRLFRSCYYPASFGKDEVSKREVKEVVGLTGNLKGR